MPTKNTAAPVDTTGLLVLLGIKQRYTGEPPRLRSKPRASQLDCAAVASFIEEAIGTAYEHSSTVLTGRRLLQERDRLSWRFSAAALEEVSRLSAFAGREALSFILAPASYTDLALLLEQQRTRGAVLNLSAAITLVSPLVVRELCQMLGFERALRITQLRAAVNAAHSIDLNPSIRGVAASFEAHPTSKVAALRLIAIDAKLQAAAVDAVHTLDLPGQVRLAACEAMAASLGVGATYSGQLPATPAKQQRHRREPPTVEQQVPPEAVAEAVAEAAPEPIPASVDEDTPCTDGAGPCEPLDAPPDAPSVVEEAAELAAAGGTHDGP